MKKCSASKCSSPAAWKVMLEDFYKDHRGRNTDRYYEPHCFYPHLCDQHRNENETGKRPVDTCSGRTWWHYPITPLNTSGRLRYEPLNPAPSTSSRPRRSVIGGAVGNR